MPKFATQTLIQNRCIALDPAPDRDVIHRQATLRHHLLQVAVAQRIAQVPSDAKYYDHVLEVSSEEQRRPVLHHRITLPEPPQAVCNRSPMVYVRMSSITRPLTSVSRKSRPL